MYSETPEYKATQIELNNDIIKANVEIFRLDNVSKTDALVETSRNMEGLSQDQHEEAEKTIRDYMDSMFDDVSFVLERGLEVE